MFDKVRSDLTAVRDAAYAPVLEDGETLLTAGIVSSAFVGSDDIATVSRDRMDATVRRALAAVDDLPPVAKGFVAVAGAASVVADPFDLHIDLDRVLGGRVGHGDADSVAALFSAALSAGSPELAVTDRRVGIAVDGDVEIPNPVGDLALVAKTWSVVVPRAVVHGVRRRRRPFEMGRIELAFTDGSGITVTAGMVSGRRADRLVAALTDAEGAP